MKVFLTLIGIVIAAVGVYFAYQQNKLAQEKERLEKPEVVVCLSSFSYSRTRPQRSGTDLAYVPRVQASFKLVNKGSTQVAVTRVSFNPTGTTKEGRPGGMGSLDVELNKMVPGNGVVVINNLTFSPNIAVLDRFWINKPKTVNVRAYWAGGAGPMLKCIPKNGRRWGCGAGSAQAILVDSACQ